MPVKWVTLTIACLLICLSCVGYFYLNAWPDNNLHVIYCDVGQGDGVLIIYHFIQVLIDSGPDAKILQCLETYISSSDKNLEAVIATHPDKDHAGGFSAVFGQYTVSHLFLLGFAKNTDDFKLFREKVLDLLEKGTKLHLAQQSQKILLPGIFELQILYPEKKIGTLSLFSRELSETQLSAYIQEQTIPPESINDVSVATLLTTQYYRHLFTADLEKEGEQALIDSGLLTRVLAMKAGHHGSNTSSTEPFLEKVQPEYVVISSGKNNTYGHPHPKVLERLQRLSSKVIRTDFYGHIEWISNGDTFQWKTQKHTLNL